MLTVFLVLLVIVDLLLLGAIIYINRRQVGQFDFIQSLNEERRLLEEMKRSVQEELDITGKKSRDAIDRVTKLAMEAEQEVKNGRESLSAELESLIHNLAEKLDQPLRELTLKQAAVEGMMHRLEKQREQLQKVVTRGERICRFFDKNTPYEEVLEEIEDKKYADARSLLAQGVPSTRVAAELGMSEAEVRLVAQLAG